MATEYPWLVYSAATAARQRQINMLAVREGRCPPLVEDGKLGPTTCGVAAHYAGLDPLVAEMAKSCQQSKQVPVDMCIALPWGVSDRTTASLQTALNAILIPKGFCPLVVDGVLGPKTCAASKYVIGENSSLLGCKSYGTLDTCGASSDTTGPLAPRDVTSPTTSSPSQAIGPAPIADEAQVVLDQNPVDFPDPVDEVTIRVTDGRPATAPSIPVKKETGMSGGMWALLGLGGLAVAAGVYAMRKKGRR